MYKSLSISKGSIYLLNWAPLLLNKFKGYIKYPCDVKLLEEVYNILTKSTEINRPDSKIVLLISARSEKSWFNIGKSQLFDFNQTTKDDFINNLTPKLTELNNKAYPLENLDLLVLRLFKTTSHPNKYKTFINKPNVRHYSTFNSKEISRLKGNQSYNKNIAVLDIETIPVNGTHIPYAIGYRLKQNSCKIFYASDYGKYLNIASSKMMDDCLINLIKDCENCVIYAHYLGSFDGYLILRALYKHYKKLNVFMDYSISE